MNGIITPRVHLIPIAVHPSASPNRWSTEYYTFIHNISLTRIPLPWQKKKKKLKAEVIVMSQNISQLSTYTFENIEDKRHSIFQNLIENDKKLRDLNVELIRRKILNYN